MSRSRDLYFTAAVAVSAVSLYFIFTANVFPGIPAATGAAFGAVLPGLIVTSIAMLGVFQSRGVMGAGAFCLLGVGLALTLFELDAAGVINAAILLPFTLAQMQILVIILGFLLGMASYRG